MHIDDTFILAAGWSKHPTFYLPRDPSSCRRWHDSAAEYRCRAQIDTIPETGGYQSTGSRDDCWIDDEGANIATSCRAAPLETTDGASRV